MKRNTFLTLMVAAATLGLPTMARTAVAVDTFLILKDGKGTVIAGESQVQGRTGATELRAFQQTLTKSEKATTITVTFTKSLDKNSPILNKALHDGEFLEARFFFARPGAGGGGKVPQDLYTLEGKQGRIVSINLVSGNDTPEEQVTMTFGQLTATATVMQKDGSVKAGPTTVIQGTGK